MNRGRKVMHQLEKELNTIEDKLGKDKGDKYFYDINHGYMGFITLVTIFSGLILILRYFLMLMFPTFPGFDA